MRRVASVLGERAPVVAVIEDVHWADPLTLDLLRLLVRRAPQMAAVLVATFRDDEVAASPALGLLLGDLTGAQGVRRVRLRPLSQAAVRELAGPSGLDVGELVRGTGGNPFLVVEAVAAGERLPASVRDAALARAGRLSRAAREVADAAAVLGQRFDYALLDAVIPGAANAVEEALARGVLVADGTRLGFRHALIREAIEASISPPRLAELHARAVSALVNQAGAVDNARLAHHAELAGLRREACRYAALASVEAERLGAPFQARLQAERALRLGEDLADPERYELLIRYSRAANFTSTRYEEAVSGAEQALAVAERLGDPLRRARALGALAWALWSFDRMVEAKQAAERAIAVLAATSDVAAKARAQSTHIRIEASAFDPAVAITAAPRARELAVAAGLEDVRIDIAISAGLAHGHHGQPEAIPMLTDALRDAQAAGLAIGTIRSNVNLLFIAATLRRHELLESAIGQARASLEELDARIPRHVIEGYLARSLLDRGRWDDALPAAAYSVREVARGCSPGPSHGGADRGPSRRARCRADPGAGMGRDPKGRGGLASQHASLRPGRDRVAARPPAHRGRAHPRRPRVPGDRPVRALGRRAGAVGGTPRPRASAAGWCAGRCEAGARRRLAWRDPGLARAGRALRVGAGRTARR